mgnify:CR=1 FL=1
MDTDRRESKSHAQLIAEKIRASVAAPYVLALHKVGQAECTIEHRCSASIGVVMFVNQKARQDDVLKWADTAM